MKITHVVVDGSNIATEGRDAPSLAQLDEAVQAFVEEYSPKHVTVVVDATFPNRIDRKERKTYEDAVNANELITPPAGAIGRGDAFILQIARRAGAAILSNDSFQEFHGEYPWLFEKGRLIGGKPVPHVGWVFMDRAPVRGPTSRRAVSEARKVAKAVDGAAEPVAAEVAETADRGPAAPKTAVAGQGGGCAPAERGADRHDGRRRGFGTGGAGHGRRGDRGRRRRPREGRALARALQRGVAVHRVRGRAPGRQRGRRHDRALQLARGLRAGRVGAGVRAAPQPGRPRPAQRQGGPARRRRPAVRRGRGRHAPPRASTWPCRAWSTCPRPISPARPTWWPS